MKLNTHLFFLIFFLTITLSLTSCMDNERPNIQAFYNIDSLVSVQIAELVSTQPMIAKSGSVNENPGDVKFAPDSATWERELAMFRALDINEPRLVEIYETSESETAKGRLIAYTSTDPENTRVNWIEIEQQDDRVTSLRAEVSETKPIYGNLREIGMKFTDDGLLDAYYIIGGEKLSMKDSLTYSLNARILRD